MLKEILFVPSLQEFALHFCLGRHGRALTGLIPEYLANLDWKLLGRGAGSLDALSPLNRVRLAVIAKTKFGCPFDCYKAPIATELYGVVRPLLPPYVQVVLEVEEGDVLFSGFGGYTPDWRDE